MRKKIHRIRGRSEVLVSLIVWSDTPTRQTNSEVYAAVMYQKYQKNELLLTYLFPIKSVTYLFPGRPIGHQPPIT